MHQRKILLLENVATQAAGVREHLAQAGFQVAVSRYEADGLKRLVEWGPDLVLVSTAHPAGDFFEYCQRVRVLAPAVRIFVTAPFDRDRLFQEYPGLQTIVDGVLSRPYRHEEVTAAFAPVAAVPTVSPADRRVDPANEELRAEFQRQLDARFLEVEELKRHLEVATRRVASAPGLEWLQSENERLRHGVEEAQKKAALALAMEQLKRSEIEVKLDNLLRMKEDFEFRAQNEIEDRTRELEQVRQQVKELRERSDAAIGDHAALRLEMERVLVEKEQIEERLHAVEAGSPGAAAPLEAAAADALRIASLEAEVSRQRAAAAEGAVALADLSAKAAVLESSQAHQRADREERDQLLEQVQALREQAAEWQRSAEGLQAKHDGARERLSVAECATAAAHSALAAGAERLAALEKEVADLQVTRAGETRSASDLQDRLAAAEAAASEAQAALVAAGERETALAGELSAAQETRAREMRLEQEDRGECAARTQELLQRVAAAERRGEQVQSACSELELRVAASEAARISALAAAEALAEKRGAELAELRAREEELSREIAPLRAFKAEAESEKALQGAALLERELTEYRDRAATLAAECQRVTGALEERERELAGEVRTWRDKAEASALETRQLRTQVAEREGLEGAERRMVAERQERADRELSERERLIGTLREELSSAEAARQRAAGERDALQAAVRELEVSRAAHAVPEAGAGQVQEELHRIQELLEGVISRARTEAVDYARRDAELSTRLQAALEERRLLQERFDRASAEAADRERRSSALLQSAIGLGAAATAERANLPALIPPDPVSGAPRRWPVLAGLLVVALAVLLASFGLQRTAPPRGRESHTVEPSPKTAASGAAASPREVWDRWTRSDASGGVLVQATLRSEQELRAEVEADRARGLGEPEARAELARRLRAFRFDTTYYVSVYLKNLAPGYPAYLDDLAGRFRLRDSSGKEVPAFLPQGQERDRRIFSFGAGAPDDLRYEASVPLGFDRAGLSPATGYLQLVVSDVGAASRRVLTWELE